MRYETQWVYECLLLRIKSKKTYEHLRRREILPLPDISTLNKYIKKVDSCYGFQPSIFAVIKEKTLQMKPSEVRGVLLIDEMKLTKSLGFNRSKLKMEGFTDLGRFTPSHQQGKKGDHALVFLFQPFQGKWVQTLGCFLSKGSASGTILHQLIIECVSLGEKAGLKIDAVVMDGATWNRNMWKKFGVTKKSVSVPHVVDQDRRLWFLSDFPHLGKSFRNFCTHPSRDKSLGFWTPDGIVCLKHWLALLKLEQENAFKLKANFKLSMDHLNPQYFQKMNVALAFQFFGVADAMELYKEEHADLRDCQPSINFCRRFKSLITAMNSRTPTNSLKPGNDIWKTIQDFIIYLDEWEEEAKKRNCQFLSDSTCYGLQVSLRATLEICQMLVEKCQFSFLMTARLNQDSLERFFGLMRDCCGSNEHPDSILFIQMFRLVSTYSLVKPPKGSNISGGELLDTLVTLMDISKPNESWELWTGMIDTIIDRGINCDQLTATTEILQEHDYFSCNTSEYVLTYISGYVARKASRFLVFEKKDCEDCSHSLVLDDADPIPDRHKLINIKNYGYLKHPSIKLFDLISLLERGVLQTIEKKELNPDTIFDITKTIESLPSITLVGCEKHSILLTQRIITFFLVTRMYFICKQANKNDFTERIKTQKNRKLSKLSYSKDIEDLSTNKSQDTVSNNYNPINPPIAMKQRRKRKYVKDGSQPPKK